MTNHLTRLSLLVIWGLAACGNAVQQRTLTITNELGAPDGQERYMNYVNGQFPGPALYFDEGDDVEITVHNGMQTNTTVHWHGLLQSGSQWSDGVPGLSQEPIAPGSSFVYRFKANPPGTYWYHSHVRAELMDGLYGPLFIRRQRNATTPWHLISNGSTDIAEMEAAARDPQFMILSDWSKYNSTQYMYYEAYAKVGIFCMDSYLINGKGWVNCPGHDVIMNNTLPDILEAFAPDVPTDKGCYPIDEKTQFQYLNESIPSRLPADLFYDCVPTNGSQEVIEVDPRKAKWVSFNFIATVTMSDIMFSIDEHPMWVYEVDGSYIEPRLVDAVDIRAGERYAVFIELNQTPKDYTIRVPNDGESQIIWTWATLRYVNGGSTPNTTASTPYITWYGSNTTEDVVFFDRANAPPFPALAPSPESDVLHKFNISRVGGAYQFSMAYSDVMYPTDWKAYTPFLQTGINQSAAYDTSLAIRTNLNQWVDLLVQWNSIEDSASHVMHKHGVKFWVIATDEGEFEWNTTAEAVAANPGVFNLVNPPYRDTAVAPALVADKSWILLRYQVTNPGPWLFHCHFETHLAEGMGTAILDGVDDWPQVPPQYALGHNGYK